MCDERDKAMGLSAALVVVGIVLLAVQVGFSDGAVPVIGSLPIGIWPLQWGLLALIVGLVVGLIAGTFRYRLAAFMGVLGTALAGLGLQLMYFPLSVNYVALVLAAVSWAVAIVVGIAELRRASHRGVDRAM